MFNGECKDCAFFVPYVDGEGNFIYGECHCLPPTTQRVPSNKDKNMFPSMFEYVTNWPRVKKNDFCGKFIEGSDDDE